MKRAARHCGETAAQCRHSWTRPATFVVAIAALAGCSDQSEPEQAESDCTIELAKTAELGNTYGEAGSQESLLGIASGPDGTVFALYNRSTAEVLMHDSAGSVVRTIGRRGGGPGEFQRITALYASSDTLFVFDGVGNRIAFYDTAGTYLGATALPAMPYRAITLPGGRFFINANINTAAAVGFPLHILGRDGSILESFGVDEPWYRPDFAHLLRRHVARAQDGGVWTANRNEYLSSGGASLASGQSVRRAVRRALSVCSSTSYAARRDGAAAGACEPVGGLVGGDAVVGWIWMRRLRTRPGGVGTGRYHDP
jgi:hypothetical protein